MSTTRLHLAALVFLAVLPSTLLLVIQGFQEYTAEQERARNLAVTLTRNTAAEQARMIEGVRQLLITLSQVPLVRRGSTPDCSAFMADLLEDNSLYGNLGVASDTGQLICSGLPLLRPVNDSERAWFQRAIKRPGFAIGDYQIGSVTGKPTLNFAYPILENGRVVRVVFAAVDLVWINLLAAESPLPEGSVVTVVDSGGTVLARYPDPDAWVGRSAREAILFKAMTAAAGGVTEAPGLDGVRRLYVFTTLRSGTPGGTLHINVGVPRDLAFQRVRRSATPGVLLLVVAALALTGSWLFGERFIVAPVRALITATQRLRAGDLQARAQVPQTKGELHLLARAFNEMAESLERREADLLRTEEQRRQSDTALRKSEERFQLVTRAAHDAFWDWDRVTNRIWRGPGFSASFGYEEQGVESTLEFWQSRVHPEDRDRVLKSLDAFMAGSEQLWSAEYRFQRADGSFAHVLDRGYALRDGAGRPVRIVGAMIDRSQQRQAKEAARAQMAAEEANRAKSEFLSRMSHELRTPLNAVLGFAQLLEMDTITAEQQDSVKHILKAGRHLLDLINEVLDISRIEAGKMSLSVEAVSVQDQIQESVALVAPLAQQARIELEADVPQQDIHVLADRQRLKQVLLNLLSNAVKYNAANGRVRISWEDAGGRVRLKVTDTGPGIPSEKLSKLFMPFERLGMDKIEGTGLGLVLSKALIEAMNGNLTVESTVGKGSTFCIELPRADEPERRLEASDGPAPGSHAARGRSFTVLYVEDNVSNLRLVERIVEKRPEVRLLSAMQGSLALDLAKQHRPDLILLDLHLPDLPGNDVLRRLRQDPATREIPVVVITADAMPDSRERLVSSGSQGYLTKPLDAKAFLAALDEHLKE